MSDLVQTETVNHIAVLTIANPPVNALGAGLVAALSEAFDAALKDSDIRAIVLRAEGRTFPVGGDITEFGKPSTGIKLPEICDLIEAAPKPVIAALHGTALGGGLELALAAHYRIALASAQVGFPEITLGLLPGAGGTQRAPRLIGAGLALDLMISGKPISAVAAMAMGLIDEVVESDLPAAALRMADRIVANGATPRPTRDRFDGMRDPIAFAQATAKARKDQLGNRLPAAARIVDCVEAAMLLPYPQGAMYEEAAFAELLASEASEALRHAFFAERRAAKMPEASAKPRDLRLIGVVGGGFMGSSIAYACLTAGYQVALIDRDHEGLAKGLERIAKLQDAAVAKGRMSHERREADWNRLAGLMDIAGLQGADLVIEAVFEDFATKADVLRQLDRVLKPGAILATNTSYLDVNALAQVTSRPGDVVGLHFFSPAHVMRLLEVVVGDETAPEVVATALDLAKRLGKVAVRSGVCDGFIGNRILTAYRRAAEFLLEDGASPQEIDQAMRGFGMPLGVFEMSDMTGLQIAWARRKTQVRDPAARYVSIADQLCEAGRFGQSTGKGWYRYEGRQPLVDPDVTALIEAHRRAKGITPRKFTAEDITRYCLVAMANEGAMILAEGIAQRPSDIDTVKILGYGFPRWIGGPMLWADRFGILRLRNAVQGYAADAPDFWTPAPQLDRMIRDGAKFGALNL